MIPHTIGHWLIDRLDIDRYSSIVSALKFLIFHLNQSDHKCNEYMARQAINLHQRNAIFSYFLILLLRYFLITLPASIDRETLVNTVTLRLCSITVLSPRQATLYLFSGPFSHDWESFYSNQMAWQSSCSPVHLIFPSPATAREDKII